MKKIYLLTIIILAFGCSGGDDGSENAVPLEEPQKFLEKYDGQGFSDGGGGWYFFFNSRNFYGYVENQGPSVGNVCWLYKEGNNFFGDVSEGTYEVSYIVIKSHTEDALVITDDSSDGYKYEYKFSVNAAGDILTVIEGEGTQDEYVERLNKTSENFSSICDTNMKKD